MELCCNSGVLGKQVAVPEGRRKPQVGRLVCGRLPAAPASPLQWRGQGLTLLLSKAPRFLQDCPPYLVLCLLGSWLFLYPPNTLMQPGRGGACCAPVGQSPRCFLCPACARSAPLPLCKREGGWTDTSCDPASAPHPTHQKGEVAERRKSAPCSCFGCSSHIFSTAGSLSPRSLCWLPG